MPLRIDFFVYSQYDVYRKSIFRIGVATLAVRNVSEVAELA